jgi:nucleotide-binding universal stress UspA family protein
MKKIVAAFDGLKYSDSTAEYAIQLAKQNEAHLVAVFLDDIFYTSYKIYELVREKGGIVGSARKKLDKKDSKTRAAAAAGFEKACQRAGIEYTCHHDRNVAIQELLHESIYADLIVIDSSETLSHHPEKSPTGFVRDVLAQAECPVVVVSHKMKPISKVVLLYDGEPSSVHAIKMFSYILPALKSLPLEVLTVKPQNQTLHVPDNGLMKEFMKRHYPGGRYTVLKGMAESEISNYLKKQAGTPLVVLGAYRRSRISRWFRPSMADTLMSDLKLPLFIAHNK